MTTGQDRPTRRLGGPSDSPYNYDGFVSYRTDADAEFAPLIQDGLEQLARPWNRRKALKVFQDIDDLAAHPDLEAALHEIFDQSQTLVFLASPGAAESQWCNDELSYWIRERPPEHLVVVLTDGVLAFDHTADVPVDFDASTAAPPAFADLVSMPLYIDMTEERRRVDGLDYRTDSEFRLKLTKIAARLHSNRTGESVEPRDVDSADRTEFLRARRLRRAAVMALSVLTLVALVAAFVAEQQRQTADRERTTALSRQLASQSIAVSETQADLGGLLAIEAYRTEQTPDAFGSLVTAAMRSARVSRTMHDHTRPVRGVVFDAAGDVMVTGGLDGTVILWDAERFEIIGEPLVAATSGSGERPGFLSIAINATGTVVAAAGTDQRVHLWEISDLQDPRSLPPVETALHDGRSIDTVMFTPDGESVVSAGGLGERAFCNLASTSPIVLSRIEPRQDEALARVESCVLGLASHPESDDIAVAQRNGSVSFVDERTGEVTSTFIAHSDEDGGAPAPVQAVSFSPDGSRLVSVGWDGLAKVWDPSDLDEPLVTVDRHDNIIRSVAFRADGAVVATADRDGDVEVWDPTTGHGTPERSIRLAGEVRAATFHPSRDLLVTGAADTRVTVWALEAADRRSLSAPLHGGVVRSVVADTTTQQLVTGGDDVVLDEDGVLQPGLLWSAVPAAGADQAMEIVAVAETDTEVLAIDVFARDQRHFSGEASGRLTVWDAAEHRALDTFDDVGALGCERIADGTSAIRSIAVDPSAPQLAVGYADGTVVVTDAPFGGSGSPICGSVDGRVWDLDFNDDGSLLAVTAGSRSVMVVNTRSSSSTRFTAAPEDVRSLDFAPGGSTLVVGGSDGSIAFFNARDGTQLGEPLLGHRGSVQDLEFDPAGHLIASAGSDGAVVLWDADTRARLADDLLGSHQEVAAVAWFADGSALISGGRRAAVVWDLQPASLRDNLCAAAGRNLTVAEWNAYIGSARDVRRSCPSMPAGG